MPCIDLSLDQDFAQWLDSAVNGGEMSQEEEGPLQDPTPCPTVLEEEVTLQDQCPLGGSAEELAEWIEKMWEAVGGDQTMEPAKSIPPVEAAYPAIDPNFFTGSPPPNADYSPEAMSSPPQRVSDGMVGFGHGRKGRKRSRSPSPPQGEMQRRRRSRSPSPPPREAEARRAGPASEEPTFRPKQPPQAPFIIQDQRNIINTRYQ